MEWNADEMARYSRQLLLREIGTAGQERLKESRVLIVGTGGLGSPVAYYLAAAGVGTLGLIDGDVIETSNLQRQILHTTPEIGRPKVDSAKEKLERLNPNICVMTYPVFLTQANYAQILPHYDLIVSATDNFKAKYLVNSLCVKLQKPYVHAGISGFQGQVFTYLPGTACCQCVFGAEPQSYEVPPPSQSGVLGAAVGIVGSIEATEAIKHLTKCGTPLTNRLLHFDALTMQCFTLCTSPQPDCPVCGKR